MPNAIGTPAKTQKPATPTKKITRFRLPSGLSQGCASQNRPIRSATDSAATTTSLTSRWRASRSNANSAIRPVPTGSAAARQMFWICNAGVVMKLSS